jgi:hypothetical protein
VHRYYAGVSLSEFLGHTCRGGPAAFYEAATALVLGYASRLPSRGESQRGDRVARVAATVRTPLSQRRVELNRFPGFCFETCSGFKQALPNRTKWWAFGFGFNPPPLIDNENANPNRGRDAPGDGAALG